MWRINRLFWKKGGKNHKTTLAAWRSYMKVSQSLCQLTERGARAKLTSEHGVGLIPVGRPFPIVSSLSIWQSRECYFTIWRIQWQLDIGQYLFRWQLFTGIAWNAGWSEPGDAAAVRPLEPYVVTNIPAELKKPRVLWEQNLGTNPAVERSGALLSSTCGLGNLQSSLKVFFQKIMFLAKHILSYLINTQAF